MLIHITGNYPYHTLFGELARAVSDYGIAQRIIVPMRNGYGEGINALKLPLLDIQYINMYDNLDRIFYIRKMKRGYTELIKNYPQWSESDTVIAHTAFSDGGLAYRLNKQFSTPYVVCIRDTDINSFLKYKPYLANTFTDILDNASSIVLLTPTYKERVLSFIDKSRRQSIEAKITNIPNGVHPFWFKNSSIKRELQSTIRLLFVGELNKRKNVGTILNAVDRLVKEGMSITFDIVGDGPQRNGLEVRCKRLDISKQVRFHGWKNSKEELLEAYRNADVFVMPSFRETFGTVYLEAMTQGLPCIYTKGEGIDGWFRDGDIGRAVSPRDVRQIASAIADIRKNYTEMSSRCIEKVKDFQWDVIARKYLAAAGIDYGIKDKQDVSYSEN
jgi:glycosyltransferase involved in cell wall biosynthesis